MTVFGSDEPLRFLVEGFTKRAVDALARELGDRFSRRVKRLWIAARKRADQSGRTIRRPRDEALLAITRHGGSEERPELHDAYVNLAARAMTEDEWGHDFETYAEKLSKLRSGDIAILRSIAEANDAGLASGFVSVSRISEVYRLSPHQLMGAIDRLEKNELAQVVYDLGTQNVQSTRSPGVWFDGVSGGIDTQRHLVAPTVLGTELLCHIDDIEGSPDKGGAAG